MGGGLYTQDSNADLTGTDVLIYNTYNSVTSPNNGAYTGINIAAGSTVNLAAANSGTYAGILFFADRGGNERHLRREQQFLLPRHDLCQE